MPVISVPTDFNEEELYVDLRQVVGHGLFLKCEGFNFAGSIKLKAASEMVRAAEREGRLGPGSTLVESSSGNLGVALSMIAASRGYRFLCVTDSRCNPQTRRVIEALGSRVHVISEPDPHGAPVRDDSFLLLFNAHWEPLEFAVPESGYGEVWQVVSDEFVTGGRPGPEPDRVLSLSEMRQLERKNLQRALAQTKGKVSGPDGAAALLGMNASTLSSRLKALRIRAK